METIDYNYFTTAPQPYHQYMEFGSNHGILSNDGLGATPTLEAVDTGAFALGSYDFHTFDASISAGMAGSVSPQQHQLSFPDGSVDSGIGLEMDHDRTRRNSSEEKDNLTPAQSRRKAQNRAAQRAFRERKERHVRDLEAKLSLLTTTTSSLQSDNERLKLLLQRAQTENEILKATASSKPPRHHPPRFVDDPSLLPPSRQSKPSPSAEEPHFHPTRLPKGLVSAGVTSSPRSSASPRGEPQLLSASATWDLFQSHPLYLSGTVDIGEVCERLKKMARCDGMGPMFAEDDVRKVIEDVGRNVTEEFS